MIARIEAAIDSGLGEEINLRAELRVEKQRETRIEEIVNLGVDETGCGLLEIIEFEINCAAQSGAKIILKGGDSQRAVEPVQSIIDIESARCAGKNPQAESVQLHATALTPSAAQKRTSNSVQSFSERTRRKSPLCSRVSSRARFRPIPWPEAAEGVEL